MEYKRISEDTRRDISASSQQEYQRPDWLDNIIFKGNDIIENTVQNLSKEEVISIQKNTFRKYPVKSFLERIINTK
ncbi:hypothetical protein G293_05265 [Candidatus Liberibacter africanus PTSAPSY]|uniref:Uncharacterized protein n=1 Tax=Candidatus Liberibacter africanus PTSAPSY TaxID=1277257 RepID=A0A0G3I446_LIBAF|nr:hypothetical protein G293_05265 [Candidatus Liberibacter africanus PTSAPSY]